jgi:hypothetical protein
MNKYSIFLIARKPILNPEKIKVFEKLNVHYSVYLNSLLYFNWIDIFSKLKENFNFYFILNEKDKDFIPTNFIPDYGNVLLLESGTGRLLHTVVKKIEEGNYTKQLFIFFSSIGISKEDITKTFDLLSIDDQSIVIGKSVNELIAFLGTNIAYEKIFKNFFLESITYNKFLNKLSKEDIFIQTIDNFLSIVNFNDVKKLYIELSKKDSLSFCSENMHERFNDLFVEYKDLLNE